MNNAATAIIAFPSRAEHRQRLALRAPERARDEAALAFQELRLKMALLAVSLAALQRSLEAYRGRLDNLAAEIAATHMTRHEDEAQRRLG